MYRSPSRVDSEGGWPGDSPGGASQPSPRSLSDSGSDDEGSGLDAIQQLATPPQAAPGVVPDVQASVHVPSRWPVAHSRDHQLNGPVIPGKYPDDICNQVAGTTLQPLQVYSDSDARRLKILPNVGGGVPLCGTVADPKRAKQDAKEASAARMAMVRSRTPPPASDL